MAFRVRAGATYLGHRGRTVDTFAALMIEVAE